MGLSALLIIGGVSLSFAQQKERFMYEVIAINAASKISTTFQVYAESARDARENVVANGWQVSSIRQITFKETYVDSGLDVDSLASKKSQESEKNLLAQYPLPEESVGGALMTDDELIASVMSSNAPKMDYEEVKRVDPKLEIIAQKKEQDGKQDKGFTAERTLEQTEKNIPTLTPESEDLTHVVTIYFKFSKYIPEIEEVDKEKLKKLDKNRQYYLFGHTDDVKVSSTSKYYKDNEELSLKRAEAVKALLIEEYELPLENLHTMGLGTRYPAVENKKDGTLENRRVEMYLLKIYTK